MNPAEWLSLIEDRTPRLRAAGLHVRALRVDGPESFAMELVAIDPAPAPNAGPKPDVKTGAEPESELSPLDDPDTFGGALPGYELDKDDQ